MKKDIEEEEDSQGIYYSCALIKDGNKKLGVIFWVFPQKGNFYPHLGESFSICANRDLYLRMQSGDVFKKTIRQIVEKMDANHLRSLQRQAALQVFDTHELHNNILPIQILVSEGKKDEAIHYLGTFRRVLKQSLEQDNEVAFAPIEEEIKHLDDATQMMLLANDGLFSYSINKESTTSNCYLPRNIIFSFVRNAIQHGIKPRGMGFIDIRFIRKSTQILIEVEDDGVGLNIEEEFHTKTASSGKGIQIVKDILSQFAEKYEFEGAKVNIIDKNSSNYHMGTGVLVSLTIPYLTSFPKKRQTIHTN